MCRFRTDREDAVNGGASPHPTVLFIPIFADYGQGQALSLRYTIYFSSCAVRFYYTTFTSSLFTFHSYLAQRKPPPPYTVPYNFQAV